MLGETETKSNDQRQVVSVSVRENSHLLGKY